MLKFTRVIAGADAAFEDLLDGVQAVFRSAFSFHPTYAEKIADYARGRHPDGADAVILAASDARGQPLGFTVAFHFADIRCAYLDYLASAPDRAARGIGAALYETMREDMARRGARRLFLDALPDDPALNLHKDLVPENRRRLAFYERLGARPIVGTRYERTLTPAKLGDATMLLYDPMGETRPLPRALLRTVLQRIIAAKSGLAADDETVRALIASVVDDPVSIRPPRYAGAPLKTPAPRRPIDIVFTADETPSIEHSPFRGYHERPARMSAIRRALADIPCTEHKARPAGLKPIEAVHDAALIAFLKESAERIPDGRIVYPEVFPIRRRERLPRLWEMRAGYFCVDGSTPLTSRVYAAARNAVDAAMTAARLVGEGKSRLVYAALRPPGHHAERASYGGFCYFNNAAIAAHMLSQSGRVAVLDIDYHHGNGTQDIFYARADVLTVSIHGRPEDNYPFFAGFEDERGAGDGAGFNRNYPLAPGADDAGYLAALARALRRIAKFSPAFLVVSYGADIMKGDPTGAFFVTPEGMRRIGDAIGALKIPTLIVQEGGYNLHNLRRGARAFLLGAAAAAES